MKTPMTPQEALQLLADALEPRNIGSISRQGYVAIQNALETIAKAITNQAQNDATHD